MIKCCVYKLNKEEELISNYETTISGPGESQFIGNILVQVYK